MRLEKRRTSNFCGISLQFRPKLFQMARTPFLEFTKKFFLATQTGLFGESFSSEKCLVHYLFLFYYLFLDLPPGTSDPKKVLHTLPNPRRGKPTRNKP